MTINSFNSADEFQRQCSMTAIYPSHLGLPYTILGLTNEAGEVAGKYKKYLRDNTPEMELNEALADELGDVLWYAAELATNLGISLSRIMERNVIKLKDRQARSVIGGSGDKR